MDHTERERRRGADNNDGAGDGDGVGPNAHPDQQPDDRSQGPAEGVAYCLGDEVHGPGETTPPLQKSQ